MPWLRDDAEKCAQLLLGIVTDYTPNWNDVKTLLRELFQAEEREKIFQKGERETNWTKALEWRQRSDERIIRAD